MERGRSIVYKVKNPICSDDHTLSHSLGIKIAIRSGHFDDGVEYFDLNTAMRDLIPLHTLVFEIKDLFGATNLPCHTFSKAFEDNNGILTLATSPQLTPSSKHIAVKYHSFKYHVANGDIQLVKVNMKDQIAGCMTKGLEKTLFE